MKCLTLALVVSHAIAITFPAEAGEAKVSTPETTPGQASILVTQPLTINTQQDNNINPTDRLQQISNSIGAVHARPSLNPLNILKNPSGAVKQFFQQQPDPTRPPVDPLGVSKHTPLDSGTTGINVTVTHF